MIVQNRQMLGTVDNIEMMLTRLRNGTIKELYLKSADDFSGGIVDEMLEGTIFPKHGILKIRWVSKWGEYRLSHRSYHGAVACGSFNIYSKYLDIIRFIDKFKYLDHKS